MLVIVAHNIRSRLQSWIDQAGSNYSAVAEGAGVDIGVVRKLAKNQFERVDCTNWEKICNYFDRPISELFYQEGADDG